MERAPGDAESSAPESQGAPLGAQPWCSALGELRDWAERHSRLLWTLHTIWALATGALVVALAHERYSFTPWIASMLAITWASTLLFSRWRERAPRTRLGRLGGGFVSYLTRVMYQDTLFFLLPFYAYSTPLTPQPGWAALFLGILGGLALLSCLDLVFDRMLRDYPPLAFLYFSAVTFAALCFLLPVLFGVPLQTATQFAAWAAVLSGLPLSLQGSAGAWPRRLLIAGGAILLGVTIPRLAPVFVPPVPLRLQEVSFGQSVQREPLELQERVESGVPADRLTGQRIAALVRIFAPTRLPTQVQFAWDYDGELLRSSRQVQIVGHEGGFRVWDALTFKEAVPPGLYGLSVFVEDRLLGHHELRVRPDPASEP